MDDSSPRLYHFVGIGRPQRDEARNGAQRGQLFDRLVRWPVLANADDDQGWHVATRPKRVERLPLAFPIVDIADPLDMPTIGEEAFGHIFAEGNIRASLDRYAVAVIDPAQVAQPLLTGKRGNFTGHPLHHVAIAADGVDAVVEDDVLRSIEALREP